MARIVDVRGRRFLETKQRGLREFDVFDERARVRVYCPRSTHPGTAVAGYIIEAATDQGLTEILVDCHRHAVLPL